MTHIIGRYILVFLVVAAAAGSGGLGATAEAIVGRPVTPISYAGVARRSTVGVGAPGVGVRPVNRGGPVNRVGVR